MGYRVEWHIPKRRFDFELLDTLPSGLWANVFEIDGCESSLIFADFRSSRIFPQSFDQKFDKLNKLYEFLVDAGREIALNPQVVNLNLWLSNVLQDEVISVDSDDDQLDLAVQSRSGSLTRLRFRVEDIEVLYENDEIQIYPLVSELEESVIDLKMLDSGLCTKHPREKEQSSELHEIAAEEISAFLGIKPETIGLGTWDFDEERLRRVFTAGKNERNVHQDSADRAAPEKTKQLTLGARFALLMAAVIAVSVLNGYREYERFGHLNLSWYITVGATIALAVIVFVVLARRK